MKKRTAIVTYTVFSLLMIVFFMDYFILIKEGTKIFTVSHIVKGNTWGYLSQYGSLLNVKAMKDEWWRLFSCAFLHKGLIQLAISCFGLCIIGSIVEKCIGSIRFLFCYILSVVVSSAVTMFISYDSNGADGAIYGLLGVLIVLIIRDRKNNWASIFIVKRLLILEYLILSNVTNVNTIVTHEVGLITGILFGFIFVSVKKNDEEEKKISVV